MITIVNRRRLQNIKKNDVVIIDVTSKSSTEFVQLSPFYPLGEIPVPFSDGFFSQSVEGIWQGLKVFANEDVDTKKFEIISMSGLKRTVKKHGQPLGHRKGVNGIDLLNYLEARKLIYLPTYEWVLENLANHLISRIVEISKLQDVALLDYETNSDIYDLTKPLSHASLIISYITKNF